MKLSRIITAFLLFITVSSATSLLAKETYYRYKPIFAWGAELGSDIDMTSHSMSSIGINAKFGLSWKWIRFAGVGAQGDFMVSNSSNVYPLYFNFRTDFSERKQLVFMDLRGGVALTSFPNLTQKTAAYFSGGAGFTLAEGKTFSSHIILGYTYLGQDKCYNGEQLRKCPGLSMVSMRLGVTFQTGKYATEPRVTEEAVNSSVVEQSAEPVLASEMRRVKNKQLKFDRNYPDFINGKANKIALSDNADKKAWKSFARALKNAYQDGTQIDIIHIGDSHIQAEMVTSRLREFLQDEYGNAGRGLITAFKLAGTNQPVDYAIVSEFPTDSQTRLLKRPWPIDPGFTGVASSSRRSNRITYKNLREGHHFNESRIFTSDGTRTIKWAELQDSSQFYALPGERVYGVYTRNNREPGVIYSTIGNNGACFSDYLLIDGFAESVAKFAPRLIVLSMGTNEAYSTKSDREIAEETRQLIRNLKTANPEALMMLWTPMECHKKDSSDNFVICERVLPVRDIMKKVANEEGLAVWDFYEVAGGLGAADKWIETEMMNPRDHVHLLNKGYRLQGELGADAFISFINELAK